MELIKHFILPGIYGVFFIYALLFFFGEKIGVPKEKWIPLIGGMLLTTIVTMVFSASYFMIQELLVYCWKQLWKIGASLNHSKD